MWLLYQALVALGLLLGGPILLLLRGRHYLATLPGRLAIRLPPRPAEAPLWIHAVSVGEVTVAATLVRALPAEVPLLVTTITPTGQARAQALFADRATVAYLPFELGFAVRRFMNRLRPAALVLVEGDYWPLLLRAARRRGLPAVVVNGRLSDRSFPRLRRLRRFLDPLFSPISRFGVQTAADRDRLVELGVEVDRVLVTGNLKFESPAPPATPALDDLLARLAGGRPILAAGSTMAGEEAQVLDAFAAAGSGQAALLLLAPRHPERFTEAAELVARRAFTLRRRSEVDAPAATQPDVVLLDTLGELASAYRLAAGAFVGGTLVSKGGHNPLEPARWGTPIAVGPAMQNFREIAEQFDRQAAWQRVASAGELGECWRRWLADPPAARELGQRGRRLLEENRGALPRTLELLAPLLSVTAARSTMRPDPGSAAAAGA